MNGPIFFKAEAQRFISSSAYSIEAIRRWMKKLEQGELEWEASADVLFMSIHKYRLSNSIPHYVFNYYANFFWGKEHTFAHTNISDCRKWVSAHETKESKQNLTKGYFTHLTNRLVALGFLYKRMVGSRGRGHSIYLEGVVKVRGIPWFRRKNERLYDPYFHPEGGLFNVDGIDWSK